MKMEMEIVKIDEVNMMEIVTDPEVYVIRKGYFGKGLMLQPIVEAPVEEILNKKNLIIRIKVK